MPTFGANTENIVLPPLNQIFPVVKGLIPEQICVSLTINYTMTGGTFSASFLPNTFPIPLVDTMFTLPGRIGIVKQVGKSNSSGGILDTFGGILLPLGASQISFVGEANLESRTLGSLANTLYQGVDWQAANPSLKSFSYRGVALAGIQQLASVVLGEVIVRAQGIEVVDPGRLARNASNFQVPASDVISQSQFIDYSNDFRAVLNPALTTVNLDDPGNFIYDSDHSNKQGKTLVQCGATQGTGGTGFIPIPDGWLIDGNYDEWTPSGTDLTNPAPSGAVGNGVQYWKVFPHPTQPGIMRGIKNFTRLVKDMKLPGNISTFVGSPITTPDNLAGARNFRLQAINTENGIAGFTADYTVVPDAVSGQLVQVANAIQLLPPGGNSGDPTNFYSINLELWTFPRILPTVFPVGDPTNPFHLPKNVVTVNPNGNVLNGLLTGYYNTYLNNYRMINSPRLKTQCTCIYRKFIPQCGDSLAITLGGPVASRIQSVTISFGRSGVTLTISAEGYQASSGYWSVG